MRKIKNSNLRPLLTEFSPYETPISFDIRNIYYYLDKIELKFIDSNSFSVSSSKLKKYGDFILETIFEHSELKLDSQTVVNGQKRNLYVFNKNAGISPYNYKVKATAKKDRIISLMHPSAMLQASNFIHENRYAIINYCSRSSFSIRKPTKVASRYSVPKILDESLEAEKYGVKTPDVEIITESTKNIRSFFVYEKFNLIYKFYESEVFKECELRFGYLLKLDISQCFPSIYTHSISWATNGWRTSKRKFSNSSRKDDLRDTFGNRFDNLMQSINHRETNGIIIGPELSRIFAEIILQKIDLNIEIQLIESGLKNGIDYKIFRYVDDYFIFTNDEQNASFIEEIISRNLKIYKLNLNNEKEALTPLPKNDTYSYLKRSIREKFNIFFELHLDEELTVKFESRDFNISLKEILQENVENDSYSTIGYAYKLLEKKTNQSFNLIEKYVKDKNLSHKETTSLIKYFESILDTAFNLFRMNPTYSNSIKLITIVYLIINWSNNNNKILPTLMVNYLEEFATNNLVICLDTIRGINSLPLHSINLIDLLLYLDYEFTEEKIFLVLKRCHVKIDELEANELLVLYKVSVKFNLINLKDKLLQRIFYIINNSSEPEYSTQSTLLKLAFCSNLGASESLAQDIKKNRLYKLDNSIFDWEGKKYFGLSLAYKQNSMVY